ncbi:predicted protein [Uncinocarpus reesii 1704]|uniref:Uncharacterized protein n=1 Tax=Uncinocarpus reesii (strain UAMH 1704) TaxID=336963 RepID=C4JHD0_UNCRE|nr:uncharacterized protein UREG_02703 [Uncinocarpus reesii 1704]EEP77854.1 predicted protein [Uncinocarpus reesii 1704]
MYEAEAMVCIRSRTAVPVPEVIAYGKSGENPTGLGPFILMTWVEGVNMQTLMETTERVPGAGVDDAILDLGVDEEVLKKLYYGIAGVLLELWKLDFVEIGSVGYLDTLCEFQSVGTPLSLGFNDMMTLGMIASEPFPAQTFPSTPEYFECLAELHIVHLTSQRNSIFDSRDCREKFAARGLLKNIISVFIEEKEANGPFKIFCDGFGPGNFLINPETLEITGVIDWEFTYAAPPQFLASAPEWLLLQRPAEWIRDRGFDSFMEAYLPKLELFLGCLERQEAERGISGTGEALSARMRQSMDDRTFWFNIAIRDGWSLDWIYWNMIDNYVFGPSGMTERVARVSARGVDGDLEEYVRAKIERLEDYNVEFRLPSIRYEEPEDDETLEYWIKPDLRLPPIRLQRGYGSGRVAGSCMLALAAAATGFILYRRYISLT